MQVPQSNNLTTSQRSYRWGSREQARYYTRNVQIWSNRLGIPGGSIRSATRQQQIEGAPRAEFALHPYLAGMTLSNRADDGQSQAGTVLGAGLTLASAEELLEQARLVLRGDADPVVLDLELDGSRMSLQAQFDPSPSLRILDGILDQVVKGLLQKRPVSVDELRQPAPDLERQVDLLMPGL